MGLTLHNYYRSSASYRVRIALNLKGLDYTYLPVHLTKSGGDQFKPPFKTLNPHQLVPLLEDGNHSINQSLAIMEYLDELYPDPCILPTEPVHKAHVRALAMDVACEIHPLNNLRVLKYLTGPMGLSDQQKNDWVQHWIKLGFEGLETELFNASTRGHFCFGDSPTIADCCLIPQIYNARRFGVDMTPYPTLQAIDEVCLKLGAFKSAHPDNQPDSE